MELTGTVYLKQYPRKASQHFGFWDGPNAPELHTHPGSRHKRFVKKQSNGITWLTGLDADAPEVLMMEDKKAQKAEQERRNKLRAELENAMGVNLSAHPNSDAEKDFWLNTQFELIEKGGTEKQLNLRDPKDRLFYLVGLANKWFAPDYEAMEEDEYADTYLYVYDPGKQTTRKQQVQELRDEIAALMVLNKRNKEQLFYWGHIVGLSVNWNMDVSVLYNLLSAHRDAKKTPEDLQYLLDLMNKPKADLQIDYLVKWGVRMRKIRKSGLTYQVLDVPEMGETLEDVKLNLSLVENTAVLAKLQQEELNARKK